MKGNGDRGLLGNMQRTLKSEGGGWAHANYEGGTIHIIMHIRETYEGHSVMISINACAAHFAILTPICTKN